MRAAAPQGQAPQHRLVRRFGPEAEAAHRFARGGVAEPLAFTAVLAAAEDSSRRLLLHAETALDRLLADLQATADLAAQLTLSLGLEPGGWLPEAAAGEPEACRADAGTQMGARHRFSPPVEDQFGETGPRR